MAHEILIVDDEPDIRALIEGILADEGYETRQAHNSDSALAAFRARRPSLVILDIWLQNSRLDGLGILDAMHREEPTVPVVMISGHGTIETAVQAIQNGAYDFIEKPFKSDRLLLIAARALEAARLRRENSELRLRAGPETDLVGVSNAMTSLRGAIEKVAPTGSRVLITGPAGAGKEVAARMLHARSRRADGPFVALNCATLNPTRFEEELFGVEAGSDPVTQPRRAGVLERAHNGTLLLDEVADMPLETQGKIVRALQEQGFERIGGATRVKVDVRVIATTNRNLEHSVEKKEFRQDLFFRLNVVPILIPPLRVHPEDVPLLAENFIRRFNRKHGVDARGFSNAALCALKNHSWPGNVRELQNVIERAVILCNAGGILETSHLGLSPTPPLAPATAEMPAGLRSPGALDPESDPSGFLSMSALEKRHIYAALDRSAGNRTHAAKILGISIRTLRNKLHEYNDAVPKTDDEAMAQD